MALGARSIQSSIDLVEVLAIEKNKSTAAKIFFDASFSFRASVEKIKYQ